MGGLWRCANQLTLTLHGEGERDRQENATVIQPATKVDWSAGLSIEYGPNGTSPAKNANESFRAVSIIRSVRIPADWGRDSKSMTGTITGVIEYPSPTLGREFGRVYYEIESLPIYKAIRVTFED